MIKPDGVAKRLIGEVIRRFEAVGLRVVALKMLQLNHEKAEELYKIHKGKPFFKELVGFVTSGPVVVMVLEGGNAISRVREVMGATNPEEAASGTIRGDFAREITQNIVHGADSPEAVAREIPIFFKDQEILASLK
jgi:nucleoside-diphosphate kinase